MEMAEADIRIVREPLEAAAACAAVSSPEAGGIDLFLGVTRAERHPAHGELVRLEYDAYPEMAMGEMRKLAREARGRWRLAGVVLWHRIGPVPVGEASVAIAVSAPHRGEAFEACRYLIDELKKRVPIWKREVYSNGARWQGESAEASA